MGEFLMSRTFKDRKPIFGGPEKIRQISEGKIFSKNFENYRRFGPPDPIDPRCPYCGSITEYENGFLVCHDCGSVDSAFGNLYLDKYAA
jgi:hypothetical protein